MHRGALIAAGALALAGCTSSATTVIDGGSSQPAAPSSTAAATRGLGTTYEVRLDSGSTVDVTVSGLRRANLSRFASRPRGVEWQAMVLFVGVAGQTDVNPLDFEARDSAGDTFDSDLGMVDSQLDSGSVTAGQRVRGLVTFDVPRGKTIRLIVYSSTAGIGGQNAAWSVG